MVSVSSLTPMALSIEHRYECDEFTQVDRSYPSNCMHARAYLNEWN